MGILAGLGLVVLALDGGGARAEVAARDAAGGSGARIAEEYQYRISWNGIPAARAVVTVGVPAGQGDPLTEVRVQMETNALVDLFWKLRASSRAAVDTATWRPRLFEYDRRINGRPEFTRVTPDGDGQLVGRYARPGRYRLMAVNAAGLLDPITGVVLAERELVPIGETRTYDVFTGEARYRVALRAAGVEPITVPAGRFTAVRLQPTLWRLDTNAPDTRVHRLTIWVAEAAPHVLLRARSEVFIGAIYLDLVRGPGGAPPERETDRVPRQH